MLSRGLWRPLASRQVEGWLRTGIKGGKHGLNKPLPGLSVWRVVLLGKKQTASRLHLLKFRTQRISNPSEAGHKTFCSQTNPVSVFVVFAASEMEKTERGEKLEYVSRQIHALQL